MKNVISATAVGFGAHGIIVYRVRRQLGQNTIECLAVKDGETLRQYSGALYRPEEWNTEESGK